MTEKTMARADFYTALVLMAFGIAVTILALQMPPVTERGQSPYSAPGLLPTLLGIVITSLSAIMFVRSLRKIGKNAGVSRGAVKQFFSEEGTRRMCLTILLCLLYAVSLGRVLFPLTTFLFVFVFVLVFEYKLKESFTSQRKKVLLAAVLALCVSASVTGLFQYLFLVNLP
ncbi:MAG: tripartite tricarboxylate transporter TctB family protein [Spirochaetales bacterium]|nr:tripartite tricarboxylate transporter TctB family protein [Spirochaetales bacterium]